ncbi:hypothetical protein Ddye_031682 [Dipteronia dyeriana]|uniref:WAT1-related protein n=1 Tax=Dipteronia dyeriana TaxID=168575 RepID=A0AAD9TIT2_9ROSI|nr:hypothetical protein Ddye_031682 [Dipteronia dyeriana]
MHVAGSLFHNTHFMCIAGSLASATTFCVMTWVIPKKGPTYPPMFNPLALIFTAFFYALIFGEPITLGCLLGSVVIIVGLYAFLWAKGKEYKKSQVQKNVQGEADQNTVAVGECSTMPLRIPVIGVVFSSKSNRIVRKCGFPMDGTYSSSSKSTPGRSLEGSSTASLFGAPKTKGQVQSAKS